MQRALTFLLSLLPLGYSIYQVYLLQGGADHQLGPDPGKEIVLMQGEWAIRFLLLALLVTPVRRITGWQGVQKIRRMLGLFAFFYATVHLSAYLVFLLELDFGDLWAEIAKRPFITAGFTAWLLLVPLALTSADWIMRRLRRRWVILHRLVYAAAMLAVVHIWWLSKSSYADALVYGGLVTILLVFRLFQAVSGRKRHIPRGD